MSTLNDVFKCYLSKFVLMAIYIGKKGLRKLWLKVNISQNLWFELLEDI